MKAKVVYYSRTGNTKKLADVFAEELECQAESTENVKFTETIDLLMIGGAVYATYEHNYHPSIDSFIKSIKKENVKQIVVFGTYAFGSSIEKLIALLKEQNLPVSAKIYICKGKFLFFNWGKPGIKEVQGAREFIRKLIN